MSAFHSGIAVWDMGDDSSVAAFGSKRCLIVLEDAQKAPWPAVPCGFGPQC